MADEGLVDIESPPSGTHWTCAVEMDLKQIARILRHIRAELIRQGDWYSTVGKILGVIAVVLVALNAVMTVAVIKILLVIIVPLIAFAHFGDTAVTSYDTSFEMLNIIDAIRSELLLPVCDRIDGIIFLQTAQMDRNASLSDYRDETA